MGPRCGPEKESQDAGLKPGATWKPQTDSRGAGVAREFLCTARSDVAIRFVPANGALERRGDGTRLEPQLTLCASTIDEHEVPRYFHAFNGNLRLTPNQPRKRRLRIGYTQRQAMRDFELRRGQAGNVRQDVQDLLERKIFCAEKIALADFAFLGDEQVAGGAFLYADEIQAGFDVAGHPAVEKIDDDLASGSGLPVARADGSGGHADDRRKTLARGFEHFPFREPLGALVVADHFFEPGAGRFRGMLGTIHGDRGDCAGVDELLDTRAFRRLEDIFRAADIRIVDLARLPGPEAVVGSDVKDALDAGEGAIERSGVAQIAGDVFERKIGDGAVAARRTQQDAHGFSALDEPAGNMAAQESGRAGNQSGHGANPRPRARRPARREVGDGQGPRPAPQSRTPAGRRIVPNRRGE